MDSLRRTSLHALHAASGARFVDFAGWAMPVQYRSILEEHRLVRSSAGLFDVSHMGELEVCGPGAAEFLGRLLANDATRLKPGRALYSVMCQPDGGAVDDLIVYRLGPEEFLLCLNASNTAKDIEWIRRHAAIWSFAGTLKDVSDSTALLALQGPRSADILAALAGQGVKAMRPFDVQRLTVSGKQVLVARTGYTGEDGFELFVAWDDGECVARALLDAGGSAGLQWCGLGARDSLRTEAGYPLYGHELDATITPVQAGLSWTVKLGRAGGFVGETVLATEMQDGPKRRVVWFRTGDRRIARPGTPVLSQGVEVGKVLSGTLSPGLNESIGSALVPAEAVGSMLEVDLRGTKLPLIVVAPPLVSLKKW